MVGWRAIAVSSRRARPARGLARALRRGPPGCVLVPLDGSDEAKVALPTARLVAGLLGVPVRAAHVAPQPLVDEERLSRMGLRRDEARGLVVDSVVGPVSDALVRLAEECRAAFIAMTTRGRTAYQGRAFRPTVEAVLAKAACPVLLVRPEIADRVAGMTAVRRILIPLDGAPSSAAAIGPALGLASLGGAAIDILYVTDEAPPLDSGTLTVPRYVDQQHHEWVAWSWEVTSRFGTSLGEWDVCPETRVLLRVGEPACEVLKLAAESDYDLIALEWLGNLEPGHCKVLRGVLRGAPCPVLLSRTRPGPVRW